MGKKLQICIILWLLQKVTLCMNSECLLCNVDIFQAAGVTFSDTVTCHTGMNLAFKVKDKL